ncbi:GNAT family N-acetyltransferase [Balneatrix alpica]|uniref:GNAT family N-acetyltransferase n=1 Tax=Balneatrix alpica TaxID=75684 RepID=A0ABV5ZEM7_9GAMM|nr:GNAT family N-acetyltransferase [Balneatrix alpica]
MNLPRLATTADAEAIAALHTLSWQQTYAAIHSARYLHEQLPGEQRQQWQARLASPSPGEQIWLLEEDGRLQGFLSLKPEAEPEWGALLDNLHVHPDFHGQGLGYQLFIHACQWLHQQGKNNLHLWVFAQNRSAIATYQRWGAEHVESLEEALPDGRVAEAWRMFWPQLPL